MKFIVLAVFCVGIKANVQGSIENKCGIGFDNEEIVTDKNNIERPCCENDYKCITEYLAKNSNCKPAYGSVPDPLYLAQTTIYFTYSNMTFTFTNYTTSGLKKAKIISFYYNKVTEKLVISLKIPALVIDIPKIYLTYRRPGQESVVKSDEAYVTFKSLIFTAIIPKKGKYRLDKADIKHGYVGEASPEYYIGPAAYTSKDPIVTSQYAEFLTDIPVAVRSVFLFNSKLFASLYIQKSICDFGADIYSI